jgi:LIVCS family branched-chain amino acid:cation transporter
MDALAGFVFGIIVIEAIRTRGATTKRRMLVVCGEAALISAAMLAIIYSVLSYLGATSVSLTGYLGNGGEVLTAVSHHYFGIYGGVILGMIVLCACLTTSIGLTTACSTYLHKLTPKVPYRAYAIGMSIFSALLANIGLTELISISVPVLKILYPLAIVLMVLTFLHRLFGGRRPVYLGSLLFAFFISLIHNLNDAGVSTFGVHGWLEDNLPLYAQGLGWILPAIVGGLLGILLTWFGIGQQQQD